MLLFVLFYYYYYHSYYDNFNSGETSRREAEGAVGQQSTIATTARTQIRILILVFRYSTYHYNSSGFYKNNILSGKLQKLIFT